MSENELYIDEALRNPRRVESIVESRRLGELYAEVIDALRPFAEFAVPRSVGTRDSDTFYRTNLGEQETGLTVGDFRRAAAVLAKLEGRSGV